MSPPNSCFAFSSTPLAWFIQGHRASAIIIGLCPQVVSNTKHFGGRLESRWFCRKSASKVDRDMPFELRALEAALDAGISVLELAVGNLETIAFPALDQLVLHVRSPCFLPSWIWDTGATGFSQAWNQTTYLQLRTFHENLTGRLCQHSESEGISICWYYNLALNDRIIFPACLIWRSWQSSRCLSNTEKLGQVRLLQLATHIFILLSACVDPKPKHSVFLEMEVYMLTLVDPCIQVSRTELDRTRSIKSLTTHLINRVSRVKSEIEEILDDDQGIYYAPPEPSIHNQIYQLQSTTIQLVTCFLITSTPAASDCSLFAGFGYRSAVHISSVWWR